MLRMQNLGILVRSKHFDWMRYSIAFTHSVCDRIRIINEYYNPANAKIAKYICMNRLNAAIMLTPHGEMSIKQKTTLLKKP